jgi:hypothetical protein
VTAPRFASRHFRLPLASDLASHAFALLFLVLGVLVLLADRGALAPGLARLLRGNPDALAPRAFGALLLAAALGTALRARLAGVVVFEDRVVVRTSGVLGVPRMQVAFWAELRGAVVEAARVALVQYDGSELVLPATAGGSACSEAVRERLAAYHVPLLAASAQA